MCRGTQARINALACIDRLLDCLDKMVIIDELIPFLAEIQCADVDITMAVIGIDRGASGGVNRGIGSRQPGGLAPNKPSNFYLCALYVLYVPDVSGKF